MKNLPVTIKFPRSAIAHAVVMVCMGVAHPVLAQTSIATSTQDSANDSAKDAAKNEQVPQKMIVQKVVVKADRKSALSLESSAAAGSRLGLSLRETPASVEIIGQELIEQRGARTLEEALRGAAGISVGGNAGSPGIASARGFNGGYITYLFDGIRISSPGMSNRPQDSWNYERIEVLKGPASVTSGEGGIGGAVNFVTKQARRDNGGTQALLAYGSYGTARLAAGQGGNLGESSAYRIDYSHQQTDGYAERGGQKLDHLTGSLAFVLTPDVRLNIAMDYLRDDVHAYSGTPLVTAAFAGANASNPVTTTDGRVIDRRMVGKNYNVADGLMASDGVSLRARLHWQISSAWLLRNEFSGYSGDRHWRNSESAIFDKTTQLINRDQVDISHDHQVWGNRLDLSHEGVVGGFKHRFVVGGEYSYTDFSSKRRFSNGAIIAAVDPLNPSVGLYDNNPALTVGAGNRADITSKIPVTSLFAEDAVKLTEQLSVVSGLRHDRFSAKRTITDLNTSVNTAFTKDYVTNAIRLGAVYDWSAATTLYAQIVDAAAPVGGSNLLLLSQANAKYPLTSGRQLEAGVKQSLAGGVLDWTVALYQIEQSNVLSRDPVNPSVTVNNGQISSQGLEFAAAWRATRELNISGNLAIVDAQFDTLIEAGGLSRVGNVPTNVPRRTANLWVDYRFGATAWTTGAGLRHVGDMYSDNANTIRLNAHTLLDAYVSYRLPKATVTLRGRNLGDKLYATWNGASAANQVILGTPRSVDLMVKFDF
jgi:iron complex outermembrane recepter protein